MRSKAICKPISRWCRRARRGSPTPLRCLPRSAAAGGTGPRRRSSRFSTSAPVKPASSPIHTVVRRPFPELGKALKIAVQPRGDDRGRAAVFVVTGIDDELVIERQLEVRNGQRVIGLDDLFRTGMRQHAVADQDAETAVVEKLFVDFGNAVDDAGNAEGIVGSAPLLSSQRETRGGGAVDVGEIIRFDVAIGPARPREHAKLPGDLLLEIETDAATAAIWAYGGDIGGAAGCLRQGNGVGEATHPCAGQKSGDRDFAWLGPQLVAALDFSDPLKLLEARIEIGTVGHRRLVEDAAAHGPVAPVPFCGRAVAETPGIGGVVEGSGIDQRPVHEVTARIVSVFVVVEYVGDAELADGEHETVGSLRAGELIGRGVNLLLVAAKIDRLPDKRARQARIGNRFTDL